MDGAKTMLGLGPRLHSVSEAWDQEETKMAPGKWRALQTPKHRKHYSGCTHVITLDRFLEESKCADSATGTSGTSLY